MFRIINYFIDRNKYIENEIKEGISRFKFILYDQEKEIRDLKLLIRQCSEMPLGQELRNKLKYKAREFSSIKTEKTCNKLKMSKAEAMQAVATAFYKRVIKGNKKRQEQRYYYCSDCNAWHLTSKNNK